MPKSNLMFGDKLKKIRESKGISQAILAKNINVSQQAIASWEVNRSSPSPETIKIIADHFNVNSDYLLNRTDDPTPISVLSARNRNLPEADQSDHTQQDFMIDMEARAVARDYSSLRTGDQVLLKQLLATMKEAGAKAQEQKD